MPTLEEFRNNSGDFAEQPSAEVQDAAVQETVDEPETEEIDVEEYEDEAENDLETDAEEKVAEEPELSPKEKTAFEKRMERERRKLEEELSKKFEDQYSKHKQVIERFGGDPDKILQTVQENQMKAEVEAQARQMAEFNGWDDAQTQWFVQDQMARKQQEIQQQSLQKELQELRISNEINDLRDNPEFSGIMNLKKEISDLVSKSQGSLNVSQAYWALGGQARATQMKREAEQRAAVKRRTRVVANDNPTAASTEKAIPASVIAQAKQMGISEKELRDLADFDAHNINEYRQKKKK